MLVNNCLQLEVLFQANNEHEAVPVESNHEVICDTKGSFASDSAITFK